MAKWLTVAQRLMIGDIFDDEGNIVRTGQLTPSQYNYALELQDMGYTPQEIAEALISRIRK